MNKLEGQLKKFVIEEYKPYSGDLFSVFIYRNFDYCKQNGYSAFMTPFVWMFIKTYEQLREYIIQQKSITTLIQMEYSAFEEAIVPICSFVLKNGKESKKGLFFKLSEFKGGMTVQKIKVLEAIKNPDCGYFYETRKENLSKIPGMPIAYWISEKMIEAFKNGIEIGKLASPKQGSTLGNNAEFLRLWHEVDSNSNKWFPCMKGGAYRKWHGNISFVVNWENNGKIIKDTGRATIRSEQMLFKEGLTWSNITSGNPSFRYMPKGFFFESTGSVCFIEKTSLLYLLGFLNTCISTEISKILNPTLHLQSGDVAKFPLIISEEYKPRIDAIVENCIQISKFDWDCFETARDFGRHPLAYGSNIANAFDRWSEDCNKRFSQLKNDEEMLNSIFINIYGLKDILKPEIEDKDVTVNMANLQTDIKSFISYAVGCMFGRYSLDGDGIAYAGGDWDDSKYKKFIPDKDNCIPITDEGYFEDDIVGLFVAFVKKLYGDETFEENLEFIANALGNKGNTSRDIIRNYFVNDFYKDHVKIYQKRPIYWLYNSGKNDGFKALVYMHRYNSDTTGIVRVDYLHKMQKIYMSEIDRMQEMFDNSSDSREVALAEKRKEKLIKQLKETKEYDEKIAHLALSRIVIDLDDGVKVNYEKVQTGQDGKKLDILGKI